MMFYTYTEAAEACEWRWPRAACARHCGQSSEMNVLWCAAERPHEVVGVCNQARLEASFDSLSPVVRPLSGRDETL